MRRSILLAAAVLVTLPVGAGLAGGHGSRGPSKPRVLGPRKTSTNLVRYRFVSRERGLPVSAIRFRCAVDSPRLHACARRYRVKLGVGTHVLRVRALDRKRRKSPLATVHVTITTPFPPGAQVTATIALGEAADPNWIAADATNVWVHAYEHVLRVDPAKNAVSARITTPFIHYGYMAAGAGSIWQADFDGNTLLRIDPATNAVVATIPLGNDAAPEGVGVGAGAVWVAEHHRGSVVRIDPATNAIVATISVGPSGSDGPEELAAGPSGVWVNVISANKIVHIDPTTNIVVGSVSESGQPILDGSNVWVETGSGVDRIDPVSGQVAAHVATPSPNAWGTAGLGAVWLTTAAGLARVDEASNSLVGLLKGVPKGDLAITAGSIWLASYGNGKLLRLEPVG
jgi:virginiamycin B lyase